MIKIPQSKNWQEDTALRRYQMIAPLLDESLDDAKRIQLREEVARKYEISTRSLYRYEAAYKAEGFSGLKPVNRNSGGPKSFRITLMSCLLRPSKLNGSAQAFRKTDHHDPGAGRPGEARCPEAVYSGKAPVQSRIRCKADADGE